MRLPRSYIRRLGARIASEQGVTAVEYAIMAAFIGAAVAGIVFVIGQHTANLFVLPPF